MAEELVDGKKSKKKGGIKDYKNLTGRLSQTSCLLHPAYSPLLKKISTLSDKHLPEGIPLLWEFYLY